MKAQKTSSRMNKRTNEKNANYIDIDIGQRYPLWRSLPTIYEMSLHVFLAKLISETTLGT